MSLGGGTRAGTDTHAHSRGRVFASLFLSTVLAASLVGTGLDDRADAASLYSLQLSDSPNRSDAATLAGQSVAGDIYVYVAPEGGVKRVRFYLDDPDRSGSPVQTENHAPYDLAGTQSDDTAKPFDTTALSEGTHTITAAVEKTDATLEIAEGTIVVDNVGVALTFDASSVSITAAEDGTGSTPVTVTADDGSTPDVALSTDEPWLSVDPAFGTTPLGVSVIANGQQLNPGTYQGTVTATSPGYNDAVLGVTFIVGGYRILLSDAPDRSGATDLDGATMAGPAYVFLAPELDVRRVRFYLDDPQAAGAPKQTESHAPYDFAGTAQNGAANPFDSSTLAEGQHSIRADVVKTDQSVEVVVATFEVDNVTSPRLLFTPDTFDVTIDAGDSVTESSSLDTEDGSTASFTINDDADWLTVTPASGTTPQALDVVIDASDLDQGNYSATATASAPGYADDVMTVDVTVRAGACGPLACFDALIDIPYTLTFDVDHGEVPDAAGVGTGFTYVDAPTNGFGYLAPNLAMATSTGVLDITTTKGIMFRAVNSQDNALGVGVDPRDQITIVSTTLVSPPAGTGKFEQAGLWFGNDEDNHLKFVVLSNPGGTVIESHMEVNGADAAKSTTGALSLSGTDVVLELRANPIDTTIVASYSVGGADPVLLSTFTAPPEFFSFDAAQIDPTIGTDTFTGVFATHRNAAAPLVYSFGDFSVTGEELPSGGPSIDFPFLRSSYGVGAPTAMAWGPDGRLYVTEIMGAIHALSFDADMNVTGDEIISTLTTVGPRLTLGIAIDPDSTPSDVILWLAHSHPALSNAPPNSSAITKIWGPGFANREDAITGLPRSKANHAINSIHFGPDGRLYIASGGNTGAGAPNNSQSEFGDFEEQPLSAAIIVADVKAAGFDGTCDNSPDLFAPNPCDVQPWATGLRNIYDFTFHSNGRVYGPDNGLGVTGTFPPSPTPPCLGFGNTAPWTQGGHNPGQQPDELFIIEEGKYHGHPNPHRQECVFKDGSYQSAAPLPNYVPPIFNLGNHKSANGTIEYTSDAFQGGLQGSLLIANYSVGDDVTMVQLSPDGSAVVSASQLIGGFNDPLPIAQAPNGTVFVGELGGNKVTILVPDDDVGSWLNKAPMPQAILDAGSAGLNGKLYAVAGKTAAGPVNTVSVYDAAADTWTTTADLPGPAVENPAVVAADGKLYAFGGSTDPFSGAVSNAASYDPAADAWTSLPPMPTARGGAAAAVIGTKIHVIGGLDAAGASLDTVEVYDTLTNSWSTATAMTTRRDNPGIAVLSGDIYVFGGRTREADGSGTDRLATVESYDPGSDTWTARASMPTARRTMITGTLGGRAQVMGGEKTPEGGSFAANEEYNPVTDSWRVLSPMPTPRHGAAAATIGDTVYVAGGGPTGGSSFTDINEGFRFDG